MRQYDPSHLLVSIHIPKCGGTSLGRVLQGWFSCRFRSVYSDSPLASDTIVDEPACLHGHFYHPNSGQPIADLFPTSTQFITVLRDPFDIAVSSFHYDKLCSVPTPKSLEDQLDRVLNWGELPHFRNLPFDLWTDDVASSIDDKFVWVGTVERLSRSLSTLSHILGFEPPESLPRLNVTNGALPRQEKEWRRRFRQTLSAEYECYDYVTNAEIQGLARS